MIVNWNRRDLLREALEGVRGQDYPATRVEVIVVDNGSSDGSANGSPVWVVPTAATRVYVDYDGDPTTGALTDPNGKKYDVHFDLAALQSQRVYDPDKNQTGMRVYSTNGTKLSVAWGEDSAVAGAGNPFLDMGTIVPPLPVVSSSKTAAKVGTGSIVPGDTIRYTITVRNDGVVILGNVVVKDIIPPGTTYKPAPRR